MILKVFSVFDVKAKAFAQPFYSVNEGSAIRSFSDAATEDKQAIARHPSDYQLYMIATWDDLAGSMQACSPMVMLCTASDFIQVPHDAVKMSLNGKDWQDVEPGSVVTANGKKVA